jgi:epoxide hydrolase 4
VSGSTARSDRLVDTGEVRLHVVTQGEGPPVLLLHGFPEFWYSWRHQMEALAQAGFCAIAPDLRGYNQSDKPRGVGAYRLERLEADIAGLLRALGHSRAHLVGHDWGGVLAFSFAAHQPRLVEKLAVLNAPHPNAMARALLRPAQLRRSWYLFFFQLPGLPERQILDPRFMRRALRGWAVNKARFPDSDIARFEQALAQPGAATAAVNWYRAAFRSPLANLKKLPRIEAPTLLIWGEQDRALGPELLDGLDARIANLRIERIAQASHWVQQDAPEEVNRLLLEFLGDAQP